MMKNKEVGLILKSPKFWQATLLVAFLVCGFGTRLFDLTDPPLDYAPSRQLRSAMISRGIYYQITLDPDSAVREVALKQKNSQEMLEPEILENIVAVSYLIAGGEYIWIARVLSSLFWTAGGLALYTLARKIVSDKGALLALVYYLFVPFGLLASRTFQPDPLMTAAIISAWLSFYTWAGSRSLKWAWIAGLSAGLAILIKSTAIFFLFFGMAAVLLLEFDFRRLIKDLQVWLIGLLSLLPALIYHIYGYFISGALQGQLRGRLFNAQLWGDPGFYLGWLNTTSKVLGHYLVIAAALIGLVLIKGKISRRFLTGSWLGFVVYGFAVSYYVTTHSYYLLPMIPLAAISIGAVGDQAISWMEKIGLGWMVKPGLILFVVMGTSLGYYLYNTEDFRHEPGYYAKVAGYVSADDSIIALSQDYGFRLSYYGLINAQPWTDLEKLLPEGEAITDQASYSRLFEEAMGDYDFFIITRMKDFRGQPELQAALVDHYPVLVEGGGYVIFDLGSGWNK